MRSEGRVFPRHKKGMIWTSICQLDLEKEPIGRGALSEVFRARDPRTELKYAVKVTHLNRISAADEANVQRELDAYAQLSHPLILRFYDFIVEDRVVYLILELAEGGSLFDYIRKHSPLRQSEIKRIFGEILRAVDFIHSRGLLLRDIKSDNVLLSQHGGVKLCDFGWVIPKNSAIVSSVKGGTLPYMSPEALAGTPQDVPSDVWSLGVLLYELHFKREPFPGRTEDQMLRFVKNGYVNFSIRGFPITNEAVDLISSALKLNSYQRPSIRSMISHPFFRSKSPEPTLSLSQNILKPKISFNPNPQPPRSSYPPAISSPRILLSKNQNTLDKLVALCCKDLSTPQPINPSFSLPLNLSTVQPLNTSPLQPLPPLTSRISNLSTSRTSNLSTYRPLNPQTSQPTSSYETHTPEPKRRKELKAYVEEAVGRECGITRPHAYNGSLEYSISLARLLKPTL